MEEPRAPESELKPGEQADNVFGIGHRYMCSPKTHKQPKTGKRGVRGEANKKGERNLIFW